jgi:hypothetical protein
MASSDPSLMTGNPQAVNSPRHPQRIGMRQRSFKPDCFLHHSFDSLEVALIGEDVSQGVQTLNIGVAVAGASRQLHRRVSHLLGVFEFRRILVLGAGLKLLPL